MTWESDTPNAAEGTDDAISDKPVASEGSSPSTVISRPGSFGGGESISPSNSSNSSSSSSSNSIDSERAVNSNAAQLPKELPKGQSNDWGAGRDCNIFVPVLRGNDTKIAPIGDIFDQPPGQMR